MSMYPPVQMNKTAAAEYCGVSIKIFSARYQPQLTVREDGNLYFLTAEMDELITRLFHEERKKLLNQTTRQKPKALITPVKSSFKQALANR